MANKGDVFAWEVNIAGTDWQRTVNARSRGQAKVDYWCDVRESWESIPFTAVRARKLGQPHSSEDFIRCATNRGLPHVRCGMAVHVGTGRGIIVGHNSSANFNVLFDPDSPEYPGETLNVHPASCQFPASSVPRS